MAKTPKLKQCPATQRECYYLACLCKPKECLIETPNPKPVFKRASTRLPSISKRTPPTKKGRK